MAKKNSELGVQADISVIWDEWLIEDQVKVVVDMTDIMSDMEIYQRQLMLSRGIPQQASQFSISDPNIEIASKFYSHITDKNKKEDMIISLIESHYERLATEMHGYGFMLASTKSNTFSNDPDPYTNEWSQKNVLPGIAELPDPIPDLRHPVEYRLKQLLDILFRNPGSMSKLQNWTRTLTVSVSERAILGRKALPGES